MTVIEKLQEVGFNPIWVGGSLRMVPIYRESDNGTSLSVDPHTGDWYDFAIQRGGHFPSLMKLVGNSDIVSVHFTQPPKDSIDLDSSWPTSCLEELAQDYQYWWGRGVSPKTLRKFRGGVWEGKMWGRYVFPILSEDESSILGFAGRDILDRSKAPKWKIVGDKASFVYPINLNKEDILKYRFVVLVESIGDMLSLWEAGLTMVFCLFGVALQAGVLRELIGLDPHHIVVSLNNEGPGRDGTKRVVETLSKYFDRSQVVVAPPIKKDFGEQTTEENLVWMEKTVPKIR